MVTVLRVVISELGRERELTAMPGFSLDSSKTRQLYLERQRREPQKWLKCRSAKKDRTGSGVWPHRRGGDTSREGGGNNGMAMEL